jgi:HNH endonuclease/AP2 domain
MALSQSRLKALLDYDLKTGIFTWRVDRKAGQFAHAGMRAGSINSDGARIICIERKLYRAASLAVLWMTGQWPKHVVDHRNGNPSDDRWSNLRLATYQQNNANRRIKRDHSVGLKGVSHCFATGRFKASIRVNDQFIWLGRFDTAKEAHAAYLTAARKYFRDFARAG